MKAIKSDQSAKKILVVDDSRTVRQQVSMVLGESGYTVIEAGDGEAGARLIERDGDLSLVISDINMPGMSGLEMLQRVRSGGAQLPIVLLTTEGSPEILRRAKSLGATAWIVKPFNADLLLAAVDKLTRMSAQATRSSSS